MSTTKITGIYVYPVKSMKGIALERAKVSGKGFEYDRRWMIVRSNGRFVTQRDLPQLSLVDTSLEKKGLVLSKQGHGSVCVPYELHDGDKINTKVWNDDCETIDQGEDISNWLTQALGSEEPLRLVRLRPGFRRALSKSALMSDETTTEFADGAPMLVTNEASLDRLNSVLESNSLQTVPMNRFRPNIVVKGLEPFAEHKLGTLSTESYQLKLCFPCQRCVVTTINQDTAEKDPKGQPFKTLQMINPMPGNHKAPAFGENAILTYGENEHIAVGDNLDILNS
jgi:uncharacterized protein YcbX